MYGGVNLLVTGAAGFIGSALLERLLAEGYRVAAIDDGSNGDMAGLKGAEWLLRADIASARLGEILSGNRFDVVFHLAAQSRVSDSVHDPRRCALVNVGGTLNLLRQCIEHGIQRFVFASTGGALYGDEAPRPTPEDAPPRPRSPYGASKAVAEAWVAALCEAASLSYTIFRFANVYGPHQGAARPPGVVASFIRAVLDGEAPVIHGDGLHERDYVYVSDAVEAQVLAMRMRGSGVFNIGTGIARTVREVFDAVAQLTRYRGEPVHGNELPGDLRYSCLDAGRARRELGWIPAVSFESGVERTLRSMRARTCGRPS